MKFVDFVKNSISSICAKYLNDDGKIEYLPIFYIAGSQTLPPPLPPEGRRNDKKAVRRK